MIAPANGATSVQTGGSNTITLGVTPPPGVGAIPDAIGPVSLVGTTSSGVITVQTATLTFVDNSGEPPLRFTAPLPSLPAGVTWSVSPAGSTCAIGSFST